MCINGGSCYGNWCAPTYDWKLSCPVGIRLSSHAATLLQTFIIIPTTTISDDFNVLPIHKSKR